jgi:hypothetical protein
MTLLLSLAFRVIELILWPLLSLRARMATALANRRAASDSKNGSDKT